MPPKARAPKVTKVPKQVYTHWLLKAEPDSRIVKGIDVKFSATDFEKAKTTNWEGVRNHQAKCMLRDQIKLNQRCLFYASNTKIPGITATSFCSREAFPDFNAWDPDHPYYDSKSDAINPTWWMVELTFKAHLPHLVSLKLLQYLALLDQVPAWLTYLTKSDLEGIKDMKLLGGGRLSVQPVEEGVYDSIVLLGTNGGWDGIDLKKEIEKIKGKPGKRAVKAMADQEEDEGGEEVVKEEEEEEESEEKVVKKRKVASKSK